MTTATNYTSSNSSSRDYNDPYGECLDAFHMAQALSLDQ